MVYLIVFPSDTAQHRRVALNELSCVPSTDLEAHIKQALLDAGHACDGFVSVCVTNGETRHFIGSTTVRVYLDHLDTISDELMKEVSQIVRKVANAQGSMQ